MILVNCFSFTPKIWLITSSLEIYFPFTPFFEFYEDLHLIKMNGKEYVLFDESSEFFEDCDFTFKINSQPIPMREFISIAYEDFVIEFTHDLIYGITINLQEKEKGKNKFIERGLKDGVYILEFY